MLAAGFRLLRAASALIRQIRQLGSSPLDRARTDGLLVGEGSRVFMSDFGSEPWLIEIGNQTTISTGVKLLTHDGATCLAADEDGRRYLYGRIKVGDRCFIGANAVVLPGVTIGDDVIVGAGSVVTRSVDPGQVVAGNPARPVGTSGSRIEHWLKTAPSDRFREGKTFSEFTRWCADHREQHQASRPLTHDHESS